MGHNPSKFQGAVVDDVNEDLPVDFVRWQDAVEFCARLTAMDQKNISGRVYRLPTEAEWEYACRAGTTSVYWFGDEIALLPEYAWFDDNSGNRSHTVGLKEPSPWGLYDMYGNVWEWCWDFGWTYAKTAVKDPAGPANGDTHVLRGGSWKGDYSRCRSAGRRGNLGRISPNSCGFRVVLGAAITSPVLKSNEPKRLGSSAIPWNQVKNSIGMQFASIPKGSFMMGSPQNELWRSDDETLHEVTISENYFMGIHEVTQEQYKKVMGYNPSFVRNAVFGGDTASRPVAEVSWKDAVEFCKRLSERPEEKMAARSYRLPTEAEWEYACRAGTKSAFSFDEKGDLLASYPWHHRFGWFELNSSGETQNVGLKEPNAWGLYDMHGNVWEWCADWYGEYPESPLVDPRGADLGTRRVTRGGSFLFGLEDLCRSASRTGMKATFRSIDVGFRIVLEMRPD